MNLNMKAPMGAFRKFHGKELDLNNSCKRFPLTGAIDEIGKDVKRIKEIGISHIIFGFNFSPIRADIDSIIGITKQLSKFAR
ncbi:MAG TPA: hypothetical protein VJ551_03975 [Nitrososphaeraceae archaeon]|nr:hypothetical protein [Nitrososphaeraceae archaeon]